MNKIALDGTVEDQKELGLFDAFDCTSNVIKQSSIDLTLTGDCDTRDYTAYSQHTRKLIEVVHFVSSNQVKVQSCKMNIKLYSGHCRPGNYFDLYLGTNWINPSKGRINGMDAMVLIIDEDYILKGSACLDAWETGIMNINLGEQQIRLPVKKGTASHTRSNLFLHGSAFSQTSFTCTPVYGWKNKGPVFRGQNNTHSPKRSHEVVRAEIDLRMEEILGLVDVRKEMLYLPAAGKSIKFSSVKSFHETQSVRTDGLTYLELERHSPLKTFFLYLIIIYLHGIWICV